MKLTSFGFVTHLRSHQKPFLHWGWDDLSGRKVDEIADSGSSSSPKRGLTMVRASPSVSEEDSESSDSEHNEQPVENGAQGCRENSVQCPLENGAQVHRENGGRCGEDENGNSDEPEEKEWRIEDFDLGSMIGSGRFGKVYVAHEKKSKMRVAIKVIKKASISKNMEDQVFHEITIHSIFRHPYIIPLFTFFHNEQNIFTVMEYASSNSLHSVMRAQKFKRFREELAAKYVCQIADALNHMHVRKYMHRDVKPENVLVDAKGDAKLADFGWATSSGKRPRGYCGTTDYMAPEVILGRRYDHTVDIWCLGVMTFELLVGRGPFRSTKPKTTEVKILERKIKFPQIVPPDAKDLVLRLVEINPRKRLALTKAMDHKWIKKHYTRTILNTLW